jgi:transposase InsO family protein
MDAAQKVAEQRLSVLQLAQALSSVSEACKQRGMSRTQFYEWKRRFQEQGMAGLVDLPPVHKTHPQTTPDEIVEQILALSADNPKWGCVRLSNMLKLQGIQISTVTIQHILIKHGLASQYDRLLALEKRALEHSVELRPEQVRWLERNNPCFRERHVESSRPGELLCQDTYYVGHLKGIGKLYMQSVVDSFGSYAFAFLHVTKLPECAAAVLHNDVLPFYRAKGLPVITVLTDNGKEFCGTDTHPFELYLALNDIEHRHTQIRRPQSNGFVERFHRTVQDEFFAPAFLRNFYESIEALQADLNTWLDYYNTQRPHLGYRNMGRRPIETINRYLESMEAAASLSVRVEG